MSGQANQPASESVSILLVEDNDLDVVAFKRGLAKNCIQNELVVAQNGEVALQILRDEHPTLSIRRPYLIFLDLNMPIMSGLEFLTEVRNDSRLDLSVIFVLSTSDREQDVLSAYQSHVAGYILKRDVGEAFANLHQLMQSYLRSVVLPETDRQS